MIHYSQNRTFKTYLHVLYLQFNYQSVLHICIEGKLLVRKSSMGVFPDIIKLIQNTYLIQSERFRWSITVGKICTPVELKRQNDGTYYRKLPKII